MPFLSDTLPFDEPIPAEPEDTVANDGAAWFCYPCKLLIINILYNKSISVMVFRF